MFLLAVLGVPVSGPPVGAQAPDRSTLARDYVAAQLLTYNVPGAALAIVHNGKVVLAQGFGVAGPNGEPVTPDTRFLIGSLSKPITALAVVELAEKKVIDLDAPVSNYIKGLSLGGDHPVTIRQLLTQTSGLSWRDGVDWEDSTDRGPDAMHRVALSLQRPGLLPTGRFSYSNANYALLGAVIEDATHRHYEDVIADLVFRPLGMSHSTADIALAERDGLAKGYLYVLGMPVAIATMPWGRAGLPSYLLVSSAADIARFVGDNMTRSRLLSPTDLEALHQGVAPTGLRDYGSYAMGWFDENWNGVRVLQHFGSWSGYHANMLYAPTRGWGVVLLTNAESYVGRGPRWEIARNALRILLDQPTVVRPSLDKPKVVLILLCLLLPLLAAWCLAGVMRLVRLPGPPRRHSLAFSLARPALIACSLSALLMFGTPQVFGTVFSSIELTTPDAAWLILLTTWLSLLGGAIHCLAALARWRYGHMHGQAAQKA